MKGFLLLALLAGCSTHSMVERDPSSLPYNSWREYVQREIIAKEGLGSLFTDSAYLSLPWKKNDDIVMDKKPLMPNQLQQTELNCKDRRLWPTHPQQDTKEYSYGDFAYYDYTKLPARSSACTIPNPTKKYCLRATSAHLTIASDLFEDNCGNIYRGYWFVSYLKSDENMGTLLSKGRTVIPRPNSEFENDLMNGDSYVLDRDIFLFLAKPSKQDLLNMKSSRARALIKEYELKGKIFSLKPKK